MFRRSGLTSEDGWPPLVKWVILVPRCRLEHVVHSAAGSADHETLIRIFCQLHVLKHGIKAELPRAREHTTAQAQDPAFASVVRCVAPGALRSLHGLLTRTLAISSSSARLPLPVRAESSLFAACVPGLFLPFLPFCSPSGRSLFTGCGAPGRPSGPESAASSSSRSDAPLPYGMGSPWCNA